MRGINFDHIINKEQFNFKLVSLLAAISIAILAGYLINSESYFLGGLIFSIFLIFPLFLNQKILIYLLIISIPFFNFELFSLDKLIKVIGTVPIHSSHILSVILIFIVAIRMIAKLGEIKIGAIGKAILLIILTYLISIIGVFQAYHNFTGYFKSLTNMLFFALLYFAFINSIRRQETILKILKMWLIVSLLVALYGFYQLLGYFIPSVPLIPGTAIIEYGGIPRVSSILKEAVPFVQYLVYPIIFLSVMVTEKQMFPFKTLKANVLTMSILLISFLLSFALTGVLCLLIFVQLFFLSKLPSSRGILKKLWLSVSIVSAFLIVSVSTDFGRMFQSRFSSVLTLTDSSSIARVQSVSIAWQEFLKYPLFGIGAGNFPSFTAVGLFPGQVHYEIRYSDTLTTQILAEMGVVGFITIVLFFGTLLTSLRKVIRLNKSKDLNFHISRGLYFMLLTYMISTLAVSGWLAFWVWFNFSIVGTWVLLESRRLREISNTW
jgi:O-antigen ligase